MEELRKLVYKCREQSKRVLKIDGSNSGLGQVAQSFYHFCKKVEE